MMKWFKCTCLEGAEEWVPLILRLAAGIVFAAHGWQKLAVVTAFGDFLNSYGVPLPGFFAIVVIAIELLGGAALIIGLFTHWAAKLLALDMAVAFFLVHIRNGVFVQNNGFELVLLLLAASLAVALLGPGKWSLDGMWLRK